MTEIPNDFSYSLPKNNEMKESIFTSHMIDIVDLNFSYNEEAVLTDINLSVDKGCFLGIAGPSGCGKSSLIKTICKLEKASGKIYIDGKDIDGLSRKEITDIIALVPQNPF